LIRRGPKEVVLRDDDRLLRRLTFKEPWIQCDHAGNPTSAGFGLREGEIGLSADLERLTTPQRSVLDTKLYRLFALQVGKLRSLNLVCWYDPLPTNNAHCQFGLSECVPEKHRVPNLFGKAKFNRSMQRALKEAAVAVRV